MTKKQQVDLWSKWFAQFCTDVVVLARKFVLDRPIEFIKVSGRFYTCACSDQHRLLDGIIIEVQSTELSHTEPAKILQFIQEWQECYDALMENLPGVDPSLIYAFFNGAERLVFDGIPILLATMAFVPEPSETEHTEAFIDLAKRGDEEGFKDLARMALANLSDTEINEMWAGTVARMAR